LARAAYDALAALARAHGLPTEISVVSGSTTAFRLRARLAIRGRLNSPKIGLFELGTHRVVHIPNCSVHHPLINRVAGVVRRALVDAGVSCYSEKAGLGLARYLQVVVERSSQTAQVVLVANSPTLEPLEGLFALLRERLGADLHSLWFNENRGPSNTILGPEFTWVYGTASVVERFGGAAVHYPPGAFGQNNLDVAEALIGELRREVPRGARVAEFYAGVGAIGLSLVDQVSELRMNEVGEQSLAGLALGLAGLDAPTRAKVGVVPGPAGAGCAAADGMDVVIADPPRKGLDPELLDFLCRSPPERFLYVSCGLDSLLTDAQRLTAGGNLRLRRLTAFNLMPFTEHVETLACFERG
jgi:tRNA/tmRNA/rRNA uracil-C5-methylase (TrmA/RlmC/RlmD family)